MTASSAAREAIESTAGLLRALAQGDADGVWSVIRALDRQEVEHALYAASCAAAALLKICCDSTGSDFSHQIDRLLAQAMTT